MRKRDYIISAVKSRFRKTTHKYGIEIPKSREEAFSFDKKNNNSFWPNALQKEMTNIGIAFEILDKDTPVPVGWKKTTGHFIWDVKMDFTRKARWLLDGHRQGQPEGSTHTGVVSQENVRIELTYAALNKIDVIAGDIRNTYLQAPSSQKYFIVCGWNLELRTLVRKF